MKYLTTILPLLALIAFVPALVAADDADSGDVASGDVAGGDVASGDVESGDAKSSGSDWGRRPRRPRPTQVLWGQCGGYYYTGTTRCPKGAYCRKFSDWYSQCNLDGQ